jgi:hypothetical protein
VSHLRKESAGPKIGQQAPGCLQSAAVGGRSAPGSEGIPGHTDGGIRRRGAIHIIGDHESIAAISLRPSPFSCRISAVVRGRRTACRAGHRDGKTRVGADVTLTRRTADEYILIAGVRQITGKQLHSALSTCSTRRTCKTAYPTAAIPIDEGVAGVESGSVYRQGQSTCVCCHAGRIETSDRERLRYQVERRCWNKLIVDGHRCPVGISREATAPSGKHKRRVGSRRRGD